MNIVTNAGARRYLVGRTIVRVELNPFDAGRSDGIKAFDPELVLDDGSRLRFSVDETEVGEYGVTLMRVPR